MKLLKFDELDTAQKEKVLAISTNECLAAIVDGHVVFEGKVQRDVDAAMKYATDVMRTPWFASEYVMEKIGDEVKKLGMEWASTCLYAPPGAQIIVRL